MHQCFDPMIACGQPPLERNGHKRHLIPAPHPEDFWDPLNRRRSRCLGASLLATLCTGPKKSGSDNKMDPNNPEDQEHQGGRSRNTRKVEPKWNRSGEDGQCPSWMVVKLNCDVFTVFNVHVYCIPPFPPLYHRNKTRWFTSSF